MIRAIAIGIVLFAPASISDLIQQTLDSNRVIGAIAPPSGQAGAPIELAPGAPPVLSFRYFDAADRGRFGNLGLMTDDAGH